MVSHALARESFSDSASSEDHHPNTFADLAAASLSACLGSLIPYITSSIAYLIRADISGYSGILALVCAISIMPNLAHICSADYIH